MQQLLNNINEIGWHNVFSCAVLFCALIIAIIAGWKKFLSTLGLKSEKSIQLQEIQEQIETLQKEVRNLKKYDSNQDEIVDQKIMDYYNKLYAKQKTYHQQSVDIRNQFVDNQDDLKNRIICLTDMFTNFVSADKDKTVAMLRSTLWKIHKDFVEQGFTTPDGLKTFTELGKIYELNGGNDIYHEKLKPEVDALEIHYPDGSIYNK